MLGITPSDIPDYDLHEVPKRQNRYEGLESTVRDPIGRLMAHPVSRAWLTDDWYGRDEPRETLERDWPSLRLHVPSQVMLTVFTFEECLRLWRSNVVESWIGKHIIKEYPLLAKIDHSLCMLGADRLWNPMVRYLKGLRRLDFGLPDFEVRLVHTNCYNNNAWSVQIRDLYLDSCFGLVVYYKGEHVLTVGFGLAREGVLITQIQLRQKKGNRFLFKLPCHYVDYVLDVFHRAFGRCLWLVEGASAAAAVREVCGKLADAHVPPEVAERLTRLYNGPLGAFRRGTRPLRRDGRTYYRLHRLPAQQAERLAA